MRKKCTIRRLVGSSNPFRASRKIFKIVNTKPAAKINMQKIKIK